MGKLNVKNGTPVGNHHLCKSCTWGQIMTGYRESDVLVFCTNLGPNIRVPFAVHECSEFQDKSKPDWEQMEKLAIQIQPLRVSRKTRGFNLPIEKSAKTKEAQQEEPEFEEPLEDVDEQELEHVDAVAGFDMHLE